MTRLVLAVAHEGDHTLTAALDSVSQLYYNAVHHNETRLAGTRRQGAAMAHEFESGFFVKDAAWHGLGRVLPTPPTCDDALRLAGLDWEVEKHPLVTEIPGVGSVTVPSHRSVVRATDKKVLGVVGKDWKLIQNKQGLFDFLAPFIENGAMVLDAAGSLREGRRVWALARLAGIAGEVSRGDEIRQHLLVYLGHDGGCTWGTVWTPVRVVCMNTLRAATADFKGKDIVRVRHTENAEEAIKLVQKTVDTARQSFTATLEVLRTMQRKNLSIEGLEQYVREVFKTEAKAVVDAGETDDPEATGKVVKLADAKAKVIRALAPVTHNFENGAGADFHRGTVYGAFNAVTEYLDHERGRTKETRLESTWFGSGATLRQRAFDKAVELLAA